MGNLGVEGERVGSDKEKWEEGSDDGDGEWGVDDPWLNPRRNRSRRVAVQQHGDDSDEDED